MRSALAHAAQRRARSASLSAVPPPESSDDYLPELAAVAASILYRSPLPSLEGRPVYVLNAAAFPDAFEVDYDNLLAYVLARLPGEDELISGTDYEVVFFAAGTPDSATQEKKQGPNTGWYLQAYHVLSRATRKKLQRLYIVHPRTWVRVLVGLFGTIVSPKFRRKIIHINSLSQLALHIQLEKLLVPPSAYLQDRRVVPEIYAPFATGKRAFGVKHPFPKHISTGKTRLPRVLRETTSFVVLPLNIKSEGIFRIPPNSVLAGVLKEAYDRGQQYIVWKEADACFVAPGIDPALVHEVRIEDAYGVHLATSLIKTWYRELKEPIIPVESYTSLKGRFGDAAIPVTPEDLVDLLLPASRASALTNISREILTTHLLPLLSLVASHESENKMNAENLAICFSMCLVHGSDEIQDAQIAPVVRRILRAAIEMWPQLRTGMNIDAAAFLRDIQPPRDLRDYEDPLEDSRPAKQVGAVKPVGEGIEVHSQVGHKIVMTNLDDDAPLLSLDEPPPILPPRHARAAPTTVPPPTLDVNSSSVPIPKVEVPPIPKRKPFQLSNESNPSPQDSAEVDDTSTQPPRYSTLYDREGRTLAESPSTYTFPTDAAPRPNSSWNGNGDGRKLSVPSPTDNPLATMPKRKAVAGSHSPTEDSNVRPSSSRQSSEPNAFLAKLAAQQAAANMAMRISVDPSAAPDPAISVLHSAPADLAAKPPDASFRPHSADEPLFRKPSWPTSAHQQPHIQSLAKPVLFPLPHAQPLPTIRTPPLPSSSSSSPDALAPSQSSVPRPRAPSPGLLLRMSSMELLPSSAPASSGGSVGGGSGLMAPRRLNLKKTSVDDLRRLYEERAHTAHTLAGVGRRASNQ